LRTQMFHSCLDAVEVVVAEAARSKGRTRSGPKWPVNLILGEAAKSKVAEGDDDDSPKAAIPRRKKQKPALAARSRRVRGEL